MLGSLFDKGLPMIISALLTKYMLPAEYGKWSLFFTFSLISNAFSTTPLLTIFSRKFYFQDQSNPRMYIYFFKLVFLLQAISLGIYYLFFSHFTWVAALEIPAIVCINFYSYLALFFRFKGKDALYLRESLIRFGFFTVVILISIVFFHKVPYWLLIGTFILCHAPSFVRALTYISLPKESENSDVKEFFFLSSYGLSTSLVNGMDKFIIIACGFSLSFLGYYSFIYSLTNTPTIIVEALKKTMNPIMYKEYAENDKISRKTQRTIYLIFAVLFVVQMTVPVSVYFVLHYLNLINKAFTGSESYIYIYILSIGFFFQGLYHFINPYYFFYKKSGQLLTIQIVCIALYLVVLLYVVGAKSYSSFMWTNTGLLAAITILCVVVKNRMEHYRQKAKQQAGAAAPVFSDN